MSCYCKARETQSFYTKCLDIESLTKEERELIHDLVKNAVNQSSKILNGYCKGLPNKTSPK
ncbi:hypothetical protein GCM10007111_43550 [Virgibacillus kapii]|uniref:Four helix bundle protein n=1 Tax=Virgibacillus kapii TaxID=1638645 RepID=A0ABQ2DXE8_9BACI|nr:hypothetical protein GCM10007111_43550 [Virgibacillus kapii]